MILSVNTTKGHDVLVAIEKGSQVLARKKISAKYKQAERLLPLITKVLKDNNLKLGDIKKIKVAGQGGGFTALRIGVVTANAIGFALGIPVERGYDGQQPKIKRGSKSAFDVVEPAYNREPNITIKN